MKTLSMSRRKLLVLMPIGALLAACGTTATPAAQPPATIQPAAQAPAAESPTSAPAPTALPATAVVPDYKPGANRVTFTSEGESMVGTLFLPSAYKPGDKLATIIVQGPWTQVKEQVGYRYGEKLAERGFAVLAYDNRFWGESGGASRAWESTGEKVKDVKSAVTFLQSVSAVNADQIGMLGVCAGAGVGANAIAEDNRIKAFATVAAWLQHPDTTPLFYGGPEGVQQRIALSEKALGDFKASGRIDYVPAYDPNNPAAAMFFEVPYYGQATRGAIPQWNNQFAVKSWKEWLELNTVQTGARINVPTMMIHSDASALPDNVRSFFNQIPTQQKEMRWTEGEHTEFYDQEARVTLALNTAASHFGKVFGVQTAQNNEPMAPLATEAQLKGAPTAPAAVPAVESALAPADVPEAFAKAVTGKQVDPYVALFAPDAVFTDLGSRYEGSAGVAKFAQMQFDFNGAYVTRDIKVDGNTVIWLFDFTGNGGYSLKGKGVFVVENGLIKTLDIGRE
jgi:uncharacterized protein